MEKIKQLMVKAGISAEAANKICESVATYSDQLRSTMEEEFKGRLEKAKQVCLEETEAHKIELSRRVQIFLETKSESVRQQLVKQSAERGTQAEAKLEKVAALVEDIELDGRSHSELQATVDKLNRVVKNLTEQKALAVKKTRQLQEVADKVLKQNRALEAAAARIGTVNESRQQPKRRGGTPTTTRPALTENVDRSAPAPQQRQTANARSMSFTIDDIAASIAE